MSEPVIKNVRTIFDVNVESGSIRVIGTAQAINGEIRDFNAGFYRSEQYIGSMYFNSKDGRITRNMETIASCNSECMVAFDSAVADIKTEFTV